MGTSMGNEDRQRLRLSCSRTAAAHPDDKGRIDGLAVRLASSSIVLNRGFVQTVTANASGVRAVGNHVLRVHEL